MLQVPYQELLEWPFIYINNLYYIIEVVMKINFTDPSFAVLTPTSEIKLIVQSIFKN